MGDNLVTIGDVYIAIDGETTEVLKNFPVRLEEGLNQYNHYVSYWQIYDKKKKE
jgi:hypothetical protein